MKKRWALTWALIAGLLLGSLGSILMWRVP